MSTQESEVENITASQEQEQESPAKKGNVKPFSNRWMAQVYEQKPPFPEDVLSTVFAPERVTTIVQALKEATAKEVEESNRLLEDDFTYALQITSFKIPHVNVHLSRIPLKHSLLNDDSEICLFVKDLKRGRRVDFEPTIQHYEKLLRANKIKHSITVIPLNQLYNEYAPFELRRKLSFAYDKFLADVSIAAHVNGFLGSKMLNKGRLAFPVNLGAKDLADEIDSALRKVCYKHLSRGVTQSIQVGKHSMSNEDIAENVIDLVQKIGEIHPGGYENVHKLHLKPQHNLSVVIPIYVSLDRPKDGVPADATNKDALLAQQQAKAGENLDKFDITAAAKLIQKRRLPSSVNIVADDHLLSDDESTAADSAPKLKRIIPGADGVRRGRIGPGNRVPRPAAAPSASAAAPKTPVKQQTPAKPVPAKQQTTPQQQHQQQQQQASKRPVGRATPRRPIGNNSVNAGNNNSNNAGGNRPVRKLNGISNTSRAPISRPKRQNPNLNASLNRAIVQNLLRQSTTDIASNSGGFLSRNNDLLGSNFNNRNSGGNFDDFRRNNYNDNSDFSRRSNLGGSGGGDFGGRGGGNSSFNLGNLGNLANFGSGGGGGGSGSFGGRGFNNNGRF